MTKPRSRLGRGLESLLSLSEPAARPVAEPPTLLGERPFDQISAEAGDKVVDAPDSALVVQISIADIRPNPHQPRREFDEASIAQLAASIKSTGLIQPIVVRQTPAGYELIAGERRLRAAKVAGLVSLPAIVKVVDNFTQAQMALIENIQREDLNPIDRALAYRALIDHLGLTQSELAIRLGEDRTAVAHFLRLLDLTAPVRDLIATGKLTMGHGKVLAGVPDPDQGEWAARAVTNGMSVRGLEEALKAAVTPSDAAPSRGLPPSAHLKDLERSLSQQLQMKVQVRWAPKQGRGKLIIHYSLDQFDQLKERLGVITE